MDMDKINKKAWDNLHHMRIQKFDISALDDLLMNDDEQEYPEQWFINLMSINYVNACSERYAREHGVIQ